MEQGTHNPYQAPAADKEAEQVVAGPLSLVLATRGARLGASLIDALLAMSVLGPLQFAAGVYDNFPNVTKQSPMHIVLWSAGGLLLFVLLHGYFLKKNGQTIGKRLLRIRIADVEDGSTPALDRLLLWRVLPVQLVVLVPYVGMLATFVDALLIFRRDQRCGHDHIARTVVVQSR
ncbi:MAG: RDD family protein [Myxococcales bacterium]|nr:MAG: RDD family protein [Myxococcales bacterium]